MSPKYRLAFVLSGAVVVADQVTKYLVHSRMSLLDSVEVIPGFANLTYLRNTGAAFGFLAGNPSGLRVAFFIAVSVVAVGCVLYLIKHLRADQTGFLVSLSLILSGAVGNLIDRIRLGEVIDFIDLYWGHFHWPAFNVADSAITIGVFLLFLQMLRKKSLSF